MFTLIYRWGCEHEHDAIEVYTNQAKEKHECFTLNQAGLFIDLEMPFIGANQTDLFNALVVEMVSLK